MVDEDIVYEDTPLADYLEEHDSDGGLSNWGIEPRKVKRGLGPIPLILTAEHGRARLRRDRFRGLLSQAVRSTISGAETGDFLERFRYALVSSDLLDDRGHHYYFQQDNTRGTRCEANIGKAARDKRRQRILFCDDGPWSFLKYQKSWAGGGGCIVVLATLLTWGVRHGRIRHGASNVAVLVIVLTITLFLYAHSRRRRLRLLRAKAVSHVTRFIANNQEFDVAVGKCVNFIMQVELLSRGYYLNGQGKNSHLDSKTLGKHIRASLSAGLYLAMNVYLDAINELAHYADQLDLERYLDMYDLSPAEVAELSASEEAFGATANHASVHQLKVEFNKLHTLRRALMCILLSIPSSGRCSSRELASWTALVDNVQSIANLVAELANTVTRDNLAPPNIIEKVSNDDDDDKNEGRVARKHARSLNQLVGSIQNLNAHLELLSESTDDDAMYYRSFQSMGTEIQLLLEAWERGFKNMEEPINDATATATNPNTATRANTNGRPLSLLTEDETTTLGGDESDFSPRLSMDSPRLSMHSRTDSTATTVFQTVAEEDEKLPPTMSRADRIKLMHQTEATRKAAASTRRNFIVELDNVLTSRKKSSSP
ncbi:hypothetical protein TRICI_005346 [Trichomonascus ciferrii]|uniref:Myosin-binding domain-containing protein n=1 Tax=Trichomonascus ciferrii TaxID=44093 RepID=A0A642UTA7_9ASCO|nr:hypothetical protein TRICI_005346 [Trichomonascus ciferrii]